MYSIDLQEKESRMQKIGAYLGERSVEIIMIGLSIALVVGMGMFLKTTGEIADLTIEYLEIQESQIGPDYETMKVLEALAMKKAEAHVDPTTGAELPPYWTAPEETY